MLSPDWDAHAMLPEPYWMSGEWPACVKNVRRELMKTFHPTAKLKVSPHWEPGEPGALLGQQIAYFDTWPEMIQLPDEKVDWRKVRLVYGKDIKKRMREYEKRFNQRFVLITKGEAV